MADLSFTNVMAVLAVAVVAPLIAAAIPKVKVPGIVIEFGLGVIVGPDVLGWVKIDEPLDVLSLLALGFLLFIAGTEVEVSSLRGPLLTKAVGGYLIGLVLALVIAAGLGAADVVLTPSLIAVILSATGLGVVIPILRGANLTTTQAGQTILIVATVAEFSAVLLLALFFGEDGTGVLTNVLIVLLYAAIAVVLWLLLKWVERRPGPAESSSSRWRAAPCSSGSAWRCSSCSSSWCCRSASAWSRSLVPSPPASSSATSGGPTETIRRRRSGRRWRRSASAS